MLRAMTVVLAITSVALPNRGQCQGSPELEGIEAAVLRELVPPPLDEAKHYVTEEFPEWLPSPSDGAYKELQELRQQYIDAIDRVETDIVSATFIGDYVLVVAHVLVVLKPGTDVPSETGPDGDFQMYQFVREGSEWLSAAAPFPYTPGSFLALYTRALEKYATSP